MALVPHKYFLTKGVGVHEKELRAFEEALRDAGVQICNLVKISSIIAPGCERMTVKQGMKLLQPGEVTFSVIAKSETNEPGQLIGAGIGLAQPLNDRKHGYLTEVESAIGRTADDIAQDVEEMAIENLITEWGHKFDAEKVMKKGKKEYTLYGEKIAVDHIVQTAKGAEGNKWTVVICAAVFIYDL